MAPSSILLGLSSFLTRLMFDRERESRHCFAVLWLEVFGVDFSSRGFELKLCLVEVLMLMVTCVGNVLIFLLLRSVKILSFMIS